MNMLGNTARQLKNAEKPFNN